MDKYSKKFVALHWVLGAILTFLLVGATLKLPHLPKVGGDLSPYKMHIIVGVIALILLIIRVILAKKEPEFTLYNSPKDALVKWNHRLIYLFTAATAISGMATTKISHLGAVVLAGAKATSYTGATTVVANLASLHSVSSKILMALIAMHIVGVVAYVVTKKDNVIKRMWF
jgi:cytochrome b561